MAMTKTLFRGLVVISFLLGLGASKINFMRIIRLPRALMQTYADVSIPELFRSHLFLVVVYPSWLLASIVSAAGLLFFKRWARLLCVIYTILGVAFTPFSGPVVSSALASALSEAAFIAVGALLAIAYFSPADKYFIRRK